MAGPMKRSLAGARALPGREIEHVAQVNERAEVDDADGPDALTEDLGDVLVAQFVDKAHNDHLALLRREVPHFPPHPLAVQDRKSTRLNSSHTVISYAVFC